jgi:hypothetical protein
MNIVMNKLLPIVILLLSITIETKGQSKIDSLMKIQNKLRSQNSLINDSITSLVRQRKLIDANTGFSNYYINEPKIDSLTKIQSKLISQISILNDSIASIERQKEAIKSIEYKKQFNALVGIKVTIRKDKVLKKSPDVLSDDVGNVRAGQIVVIKDYSYGYCGVCSDSVCGYINEMWIEKDSIFKSYLKFQDEEIERKKNLHIKELSELEENRKLYEEKLKLDEEKRKLEIKKQYGNRVYNDILLGKYWIGMTSEMARMSLGSPEKINRTVNQWGVSEQWIYPNDLYLYFDDYILTTYQEH